MFILERLLVFLIPVNLVLAGQIKQLWPLDSQTCESEVLGNTYKHNIVCMHSFATQPPDIPFRSMFFDGSIYVHSPVNFSASTIDHYSVQGLFYFTHNTGVLFHYRAEQSDAEVILSINYGKLQLYRKVTSGADATYSGGISISINTWYDISFGVGRAGVVYVNVNGNRDIEIGNIHLHLRNTTEIPGNLRIGARLDGLSNTAFHGIIACVGFIWSENEPLISELLKLCEATPWMPPRSADNLHFSNQNDTTYYPELIMAVTRCSLIQCAYACLHDLRCFNVYYDEDIGGCSSCFMFSRVEAIGASAPQTLKLYSVRL